MSDDQAALRPNRKLDAALALAKYGFSIFPLIPNDKRPLIDGWQAQATNDEARVKQWWVAQPDANIGISTERLLVIDVDPRNGGDITFRSLFDTQHLIGEDFDPTLAAGTQASGTHMFYHLPDGVTARGGANKLGPGVDVKSHGGYVVGAGSTIDGRAYAWKKGYEPDKRNFAQAPEWLITKCNTAKPKSADAGKVIVLEDERAIRMCRDYIENNAPHADVGERGYTAYKVACRFYDFGVSKETCQDLLIDWSESHCEAPMDRGDIEHAAWSALRNRENAIGSKHPDAPGFEPVTIMPQPEIRTQISDSAAPFFTQVKRFEARDLPLRPWVIPGFACRARVTMLAGPGGVAKSTYTLMVAVAVVTARGDICGFPVPERQKVAVWNQEDDLEEMQRRLAAIMDLFNVSWADLEDTQGNPMLYLNSGVDNPMMIALRSQEGVIRPSRQVEMATSAIVEEGISLLVLDPLVELHQAVENDNVQMRAVVSLVRDIAVKGNCAVLLATHTKKPPTASSDGFAGEMDAARGASSQFGVIRIGATLFSASPKDAKTWKMEGTHLNYVRLDIAKNNLAARSGEPMWFRRESAAVGGSLDAPGESVGVLKPVELGRKIVEPTESIVEMLAEAMTKAPFNNGEWHRAADVLTAAGFTNDNETRNRAKFLDGAFDGNEQVETQVGRLFKNAAKERSPTRLKLIPHLRKDADGDADGDFD